MNKLSRRKYADLVKFLKGVIKNEKTSLRVRMSAAQRLDDIYARHELADLKRLEREAIAGEKITPGAAEAATEPSEPAPRAETALEAAERFLQSIRQRGEARNGK